MSKVKICGLTRCKDIDAVNTTLPDFIGFVFAPSRRKVDIETAIKLKQRLDKRIKAVGVFVNEKIEVIADIYNNGVIDLAQLHGDEDSDYIGRLKNLCACPVIKAVGIGDSLPALPANADYILFDTLSPARGGSGRTFDWSILKGYNDKPYFLAGGLNSGNVLDAVSLLKPFCVDVSGGVETDYGMGSIKDIEKIKEFVNKIRGVQ